MLVKYFKLRKIRKFLQKKNKNPSYILCLINYLSPVPEKILMKGNFFFVFIFKNSP